MLDVVKISIFYISYGSYKHALCHVNENTKLEVFVFFPSVMGKLDDCSINVK